MVWARWSTSELGFVLILPSRLCGEEFWKLMVISPGLPFKTKDSQSSISTVVSSVMGWRDAWADKGPHLKE